MKRIATFLILTTAALLPIAANAEIFTEGKHVAVTTEKLKPTAAGEARTPPGALCGASG